MRFKNSIWALLFLSFFGQQLVNGQEGAIQLYNPSFEDHPMNSRPPRGWTNCGFPGESPPDTQPDPTFQVNKNAHSGSTYLGMVVRDNDTWESVAQRLSQPLKKGSCYEFSIYISRSELYVSPSRVNQDRDVNYTTPAKLRIYGGFDHCDKQYLLAETKEVVSFRWLQYNFKFEPIDDYTHLIFEVFYKTPTLFPYNGNILLDDASAIVPIPCEEEEEEVEVEAEPEDPVITENVPPVERPTEQEAEKKSPPPPEVAPPTTPAPPVKEEPASIAELKREDLKEGQTIRIDKLFFAADKAVISNNSFTVLDEVFDFLNRNQDVVIEVGGHTNGLCSDSYCNKLSSDRAKAVADYLVGKGITNNRISFKGYGKTQQIASNETDEGRKKNQRVEIKILGFNG